jgi:hypothetical protein
VSPAQGKAIAAKATENFRMLGLKTEVVYYDKKMTKESYTQLDRSDAVAIIGQRQNVVNAVNSFNPSMGKELDDQNFGYGPNPEQSSNPGKVIALETQKTKDFAKDVGGKETFESAAAMAIIHGRGHNAGMNHQGDDNICSHCGDGISYPKLPEVSIMSDADLIVKTQEGFSPFLKTPNNTISKDGMVAPAEWLKKTYGNADVDAKLIDKRNRDPKRGAVMLRNSE